MAAVMVRDSLPATATHAAARGTLSERRPVVKDVLSFSALIGARSGTAGDALTKKQRGGDKRLHLEIEGVREGVLLTSNWRSSVSSSSRAGGTSTAPAGASAVPAGTSTDNPVAGGSMPASGVNSTAAPRPVGMAARVPTCQRWSAPRRYPSCPTTSSPTPAEGRALPTCAIGTPRCTARGALAA
jgi:hypothetical protein